MLYAGAMISGWLPEFAFVGRNRFCLILDSAGGMLSGPGGRDAIRNSARNPEFRSGIPVGIRNSAPELRNFPGGQNPDFGVGWGVREACYQIVAEFEKATIGSQF